MVKTCRLALFLTVAATVSMACAQTPAMPAAYQQVLTILGKQGDYSAQVLKINIPRNDLTVTVDGVATPTAFGFGGWLAMTKGSAGKDVMMGDLVLTEDEVNPVMSALLDHGLQVTALHNHFFFEHPRLFFMHVMGYGDALTLAREAKPAVDLIGHVPNRHPEGAAPAINLRPGKIDTARLASIVGHAGQENGSVYKITVGRDDLHLTDMGATINSRMGLNTWAAFVGNDADAAVAGDVAMRASEVQPVLKALRGHGLEVVAIHQHMIGTQPAIYFLHYWGRGPAAGLAAGFRAALDQLGKH